MSEASSNTISIEAPLAHVQEILFDIEKYPTWSTAIKSAEILSKDDQGRVTSAKLSIDAGMMRDRVSLDYDWSEAPTRLSFSLADADLLTGMDGAYVVEAEDDDTTKVTYELTVSLSMPIPAMMRTKAEKTTIDQALSQLKAFAEK
ncbi:MAG: polyketide cyclase / dehydrase and lipid transport [Streptomycetaceae bacterium]|nr:MAG: polyketide cyclase / dehydrase and lipid transport [Streptomycetaceae bacterium]